MRKTMRLQTKRQLIALRDRIKKSEASCAAINQRAYELERQMMAGAIARDRLKAFLEGRA